MLDFIKLLGFYTRKSYWKRRSKKYSHENNVFRWNENLRTHMVLQHGENKKRKLIISAFLRAGTPSHTIF